MASTPARVTRTTIALLVVLAVAVVALMTARAAMTRGPADAEAEPMLQVAPSGTVELATLPAEHQARYRAAAADPDAFTAVTCYCGCVSFLDHRHLRDCFVRPDGGWERHASACSVCLAEARDVAAMRADEVPIDQIVRRIDRDYGEITSTT